MCPPRYSIFAQDLVGCNTFRGPESVLPGYRSLNRTRFGVLVVTRAFFDVGQG